MSEAMIRKRKVPQELLDAGTPLAPSRDGGGVRVPLALRPERGFTLFEALVVLAIMGFIAALAAVQINNIWQKSRLRSEAGNLAAFLQSAYIAMVGNRAPVYVQLTPANGTQALTLLICQQPNCTIVNGHGSFGQPYTLPSFATLNTSSVGTVNGLDSKTVWPCGGGSGCPTTCTISTTTPGVLEVDTMGRAVDPCTGSQVTAVQQLLMTHVSMISGSLTPETVYTVQVFPVWKVQQQHAP